MRRRSSTARRIWSLGDAIGQIGRDCSEWARQAVAGLGLVLGGLPLRAYGEVR